MKNNNYRLIIYLLGLIFLASWRIEAILPCQCQENRILLLQTPRMEGEDVFLLQSRLKDLNIYRGRTDGVYDLEVARAVAEYQVRQQLEPNGVVDAQTWELLGDGLFPVATAQKKQPPEGQLKIVVDLYKRILTLYNDGEIYQTYPVSVGKVSSKTPVGEWAIIGKSKDWGGGFGTRWLGLNVPWGIFGIHGTNKPWSIGQAASQGCVRMYNRHIEQLFDWVPVKTRVDIIGERLPISVNRELRPGQSGLSVMQLQDNLQQQGFDPGYRDARYGPTTVQAVQELESQFRLKVDGIVDWNVLFLLDLPKD
ncbi:MAG: peptidoglycan-binding protein [Halanaerobiales bacterium]|nr:peptidoglycan-binding protein [Halanaerobiales bacterium]